jgi:hypothetical protein
MNSNSQQKRIAFGYNRGPINQIELHPGQAAAVALIFKAYAEGDSIAQIAGMLEAAKIPSPQNKPTWGKQAISNVLSNPHYLGEAPYIQIVDQELYDQVQAIKSKHASNHRR